MGKGTGLHLVAVGLQAVIPYPQTVKLRDEVEDIEPEIGVQTIHVTDDTRCDRLDKAKEVEPYIALTA